MRTSNIDEALEPTEDDKIVRANPVDARPVPPPEEVLEQHDRRLRKG